MTSPSQLLSALASYLPRFVLRQLARDPLPPREPAMERVEAAILVADISGFTSLAERLAARGPEGLEELTRVLNDSFSTLLGGIEEHGGDVVKFAGDAVLALWREDDGGGATARAAACALELQRAGSLAGAEPRVSLRIGVGFGMASLSQVGGMRGRWEIVAAGDPTRQASVARLAASPGEVVLSAAACAAVGDAARGEPAAILEGALRLAALEPPPAVRRSELPPPPDAKDGMCAFIPGAVLPRLYAGQEQWRGEVRRLSALFVGIPGSSTAGPDELARLQRIVSTFQESLYRHEGSINKIVVDEAGASLVGAFGMPPLSHEDDASRALQTALELRERLGSEGIAGSIGIATGSAFCGPVGSARRREYTMIGDVVNVAARLMQSAAATGMDVLCDLTTRRDAGSRFEIEALLPLSLKGKAEPIPAFRPVGEKARPATRMRLVGRFSERRVLELGIGGLGRDRRSALVIVQGETGVGKSTLLEEARRLAAGAGVRALAGWGDAMEGSTALLAWRPVLLDLLDLPLFATPEERWERLTGALVGEAELRLAPVLAPLLEVRAPETDVSRQLAGSVRIANAERLILTLLRRGNRAPLLLTFDDAHWMDSASWGLVVRASQALSPGMIVVAARPLPEPVPRELLLLLETPHVAALQLGPLLPEEALHLACRKLDVDALDPALGELVWRRAEGHPFFTEELVRSLRDEGRIEISGRRASISGGSAASSVDLSSVALPDSVQGLVTGRIDRLSPAEQAILKTASVIGRSFLRQTLDDVLRSPEERERLGEALDAMERHDLIRREAAEDAARYTFSHTLTREVAYGLMLSAERRALHREVAIRLEERGDAPVALLAHHWLHAEVPLRAYDRAEEAVTEALERDGHREAFELLQAMVHLDARQEAPAAPLRRAAWARMQGQALLGLGRLAEGRALLELALGLLGDRPPASRGGLGLGITLEVGRQLDGHFRPATFARPPVDARSLLESARASTLLAHVHFLGNDPLASIHAALVTLNRAELAGASVELARAYASMSVMAGLVPLHAVAQLYARRARETAAALDHLGILSFCLVRTSIYGIGVGSWDQVQGDLALARDIALGMGDQPRLQECRVMTALTAYSLGAFERSLEHWAAVVTRGGTSQNQLHQAWGLAGQGECLLRMGRPAEARMMLERALELYRSNADRISEITAYGNLAAAHLAMGELDAAEVAAGKAAERIALAPPTSFSTREGYAAVAEVMLRLWMRDRSPERRRRARAAVGAAMRYAKVFPIGRPRANLLLGRWYWQDGREAVAERCWRRAAEDAVRLAMPYEEGLAHLEMARCLPRHDALGRDALRRAEAIFAGLDLPASLVDAATGP